MTPAPAPGSAEITWPSCTAPACPHIFKNGLISAEGHNLRYIEWGVFHFKNAKLGEAECHLILAGFAVNRTGGGRAEGKVQAFTPYECRDGACEGQLGEIKVNARSTLPWKAEVMENAAKEFFQKTGFKGPTENKKANPATEPGQVEFNINCTAPSIGASDFFGVTNYKILNDGISIGSAPNGEETLAESANPANMRNLESETFGPGEMAVVGQRPPKSRSRASVRRNSSKSKTRRRPKQRVRMRPNRALKEAHQTAHALAERLK
jgi:hypothetical protein